MIDDDPHTRLGLAVMKANLIGIAICFLFGVVLMGSCWKQGRYDLLILVGAVEAVCLFHSLWWRKAYRRLQDEERKARGGKS